MLEYIKRKLCHIQKNGIDVKSFPKYYEENNKVIKELDNGQKFIVEVDADGQEIIIRELKCQN